MIISQLVFRSQTTLSQLHEENPKKSIAWQSLQLGTPRTAVCVLHKPFN